MRNTELSIIKRFTVEKELHRNDIAGTEVFLAKDNDFRRRIVLKIMHFKNEKQRHIIENEVKNQIQLEYYSAFIPKIYNYYVDESALKIIIEMQSIEGRTLRSIIDDSRNHRKDEAWYVKNYHLYTSIVKTVSQIHEMRDFVHMDLKPENIIINRRNEAYILDFGISGPGMVSKGVGTERYMAPEQMSRANSNFVYQSTDIYALGQIAMELFGLETLEYGVDLIPNKDGKEWEKKKDISAIGGRVYQDLASIIDRTLKLNPKDRYENARPLYEALLKQDRRRRR